MNITIIINVIIINTVIVINIISITNVIIINSIAISLSSVYIYFPSLFSFIFLFISRHFRILVPGDCDF